MSGFLILWVVFSFIAIGFYWLICEGILLDFDSFWGEPKRKPNKTLILVMLSWPIGIPLYLVIWVWKVITSK